MVDDVVVVGLFWIELGGVKGWLVWCVWEDLWFEYEGIFLLVDVFGFVDVGVVEEVV